MPIPSPPPTTAQVVEQIGTTAIEGGLAALTGGAGAAPAANALAGFAVAAARAVAGPKIDAAIAPLHARLAALEASADTMVTSHPLLQMIVGLLSRFFPHETAAMEGLITPPPPPPPPA